MKKSFLSSMLLALLICLGDLQAQSGGGPLIVRARGNSGAESIQLRLDDITVQSWNLSTSYQEFVYTPSQTSANVKIFFDDAGGGTNDVQVDYIEVADQVFQAEGRQINTGVWQGGCGGSFSEWIHCAGYIDFGMQTFDDINPPPGGLSVSPSSLSFAASSGSQVVSVTSNVNWTVSDNQSWISFSPGSGSNNGTFTVAVTQNTSSNSRTGTVTVSGGTMVRTISITQAAGGSFTITLQENDFAGICGYDGTIDNNHLGFTGSGFINTPNQAGSGIDWTLDLGGGTYTIVWRYANGGGGNRPANLLQDGIVVGTNLSFPSTGSWATWSTYSTTVNLDGRVVRLRLQATGSGGLANIDYLQITGLDPEPTACGGGGGRAGAGLVEDGGSGLRIYPNPVKSNEAIAIQLSQVVENPNVEVFDLSGRLLLSQQFDTTQEILINEGLPQGTYIVNISSTTGQSRLKLLVR